MQSLDRGSSHSVMSKTLTSRLSLSSQSLTGRSVNLNVFVASPWTEYSIVVHSESGCSRVGVCRQSHGCLRQFTRE